MSGGGWWLRCKSAVIEILTVLEEPLPPACVVS